MVEATHSKSMMDCIKDAIAKLTSSYLSMSTKIDDLIHHMTQLETTQHSQHSPASSATNPTTFMPSESSHRLKLEVPCFDGSNPTGWIFKITQFFEYHATSDHEWLTIASFYMDGPALAWFQWMHCNAQLTSWSAFLHALETQFASSTYEDTIRLLFKLTQRAYVNEYLSEFESLANQILGLSVPFLLSCSIFGLSLEIRCEVQALQPLSLI